MTLVEIMVALVLLGVIGGAIMRVILRQQQFYNGASQIMTTRGQLRQAASVLPVDLRNLSSVGGDILEVTDSSIQFRVNVGTSVVCQIVDATHIALPPLELASKVVLTSWVGGAEPEKDENVNVFVFNDSTSLGTEDDTWQQFRLKDLTPDASKCVGVAQFFPTISIADIGKPRPVLEIIDPLGPMSSNIKVGAPVRLTRRVQYALFQAGDGRWYLGYAEYDRGLGKFKQLEPVSGPFDPRSSGALGLSFRYYRVDGTEVAAGADDAARASIARIDLVVRGRTAGQVDIDGVQNGVRQEYRDSLAVSVMLRNRT